MSLISPYFVAFLNKNASKRLYRLKFELDVKTFWKTTKSLTGKKILKKNEKMRPTVGGRKMYVILNFHAILDGWKT